MKVKRTSVKLGWSPQKLVKRNIQKVERFSRFIVLLNLGRLIKKKNSSDTHVILDGNSNEVLDDEDENPFPDFQKNDEEINSFLEILEWNSETKSSFYKMATAEPPIEDGDPHSFDEPSNEIDGSLLEIFEDETLPMNYYTKNNCKFLKVECTLERSIKLFYEEKVAVSKEKAIEIFKNTMGQSSNSLWFEERKLRISASKAQRILKAKKDITRFKYCFSQNYFDNEAMKYGRETEPIAIKKYEEVMGNVVRESGLIIKNSQPFISGSPDGIIINPEESNRPIILEVKCPHSLKDSETIDIGYINKNGELKKSHQYYMQIQINLYVSNSLICHFFIYTNNMFKLIVIEKDESYL